MEQSEVLKGRSPFASSGPVDDHRPHRYKNEFRWRVMPPEKAAEKGFFDRSFGNKKKAVAYQKRVKAQYPDDPCCLCDTGKYTDVFGNIYRSKEGR